MSEYIYLETNIIERQGQLRRDRMLRRPYEELHLSPFMEPYIAEEKEFLDNPRDIKFPE